MKQGKILSLLSLKLAVFTIFGFLIACSDTEFSQTPPSKVEQEVGVSKIDILFVVDNSGSMYVEQVKLAEAFYNLLDGLLLNKLDYRIAITTTDVVSSVNKRKALNGLPAGALQDGNFISFPDGNKFLDKNSANIQRQFGQTIRRQETLDCEASNFEVAKCPSSDERGIMAANLALRKNTDFFRAGSHVAFVFLTDEDVRGNALKNPKNRPELQPEYGDYPESLITSVFEGLGASHTMSSHAIIVEEVLDPSCLSKQNYQIGNENILGRVGTFYRSLSNPTYLSRLDPTRNLLSYAPGKMLQGTVGSICSNNYVSQIGSMVNILAQDSNRLIAKKDLDCTPEPDTFSVESCPAGVTCRLSSDEKSVIFIPSLRPDQTASFSYLCYK